MMSHDDLLRLTFDVDGEIGCLHMAGRLLAESRFETERILRDWLENDIKYVVVECQELRHIDSGGLSTLLGALHRMEQGGGMLVLSNVQSSLHAVFEITSMKKFFKVFGCVNEAKDYLRSVKGDGASDVAAQGEPQELGGQG